MSNDPKKGQSPGAAAPAQSLEDAVYQPSLAAGNKAINRGNPVITWATTILMYGAFAGAFVALAKTTEVGKKALKTVGVQLEEQADVPPPPPPPPPPAATARGNDLSSRISPSLSFPPWGARGGRRRLTTTGGRTR